MKNRTRFFTLLLVFSLLLAVTGNVFAQGGDTEETTTDPVVEEPVVEEPVVEEPVVEEPVVEEPVVEEPVVEEPVVDETVVEIVEETTEEVVEETTEEVVVEEETTEEVVVEETIDEVVVEETTAEAAEIEAADEVGASASLAGSFTSQIIAIANLNDSSSSSDVAALALDEIGGTGTGSVTSAAVFPQGVTFINSADLPSTGEFAGIVSTAFPAAAVVLNTNTTAKVADAYPGLGSAAIATTLYGTLIFNSHANFESILYCQNAGSASATISAELYLTGEATAKVTLTSSSLTVGEGVKWDIADDATVQAAWPGGTGQYGYAKFTSSESIACVVDNQRLASPYVQSLFQAVPSTGFSSQDLRLPLIFNGHGSTTVNAKAVKWNTGISFVNTNASDSTVEVVFTASNATYTNTCTGTIPANGSGVWYAPSAGVSGVFASCTGGAMSWPGPTYGSVKVTADVGVLAIANANRYDTNVDLGAGYSGIGAAPSGATYRAVCPLAFNKDVATDWITGIQVANVGTTSTDINVTMVKAGADPASNSLTIAKTGVASGSSTTAYFPNEATAFTSFEGAVFVEATDTSALIAASSSNTNYSTLGAAALYDCINY